MNDSSIERLLRWRLEQAEAEAPPAPRAARLLALAQPWWERWPEEFSRLSERLASVQVAYGHASTRQSDAPEGRLLPTLIVRMREEVETAARLLYLQVRDDRLRMRFQLDATMDAAATPLEATFVSEQDGSPLFSALLSAPAAGEFRIDVAIDPALVQRWEALKVTDRMPFRLILRAGPADSAES